MSSATERLQPIPVTVFAVLTLLIWTNRIWLAWTNDEDTVIQKLVWSTPITLFVIAAAALVVLILRRATGDAVFEPLVKVFAAGTTIYWAIRIVIILSNDHAGDFKAVHSVLALVSVAAAIWAWRSVDRSVAGRVRQRDGGQMEAAG